MSIADRFKSFPAAVCGSALVLALACSPALAQTKAPTKPPAPAPPKSTTPPPPAAKDAAKNADPAKPAADKAKDAAEDAKKNTDKAKNETDDAKKDADKGQDEASKAADRAADRAKNSTKDKDDRDDAKNDDPDRDRNADRRSDRDNDRDERSADDRRDRNRRDYLPGDNPARDRAINDRRDGDRRTDTRAGEDRRRTDRGTDERRTDNDRRDLLRDNRRDAFRAADFGLWLKTSNDGLVITDVSTRGAIAKLGFAEGDMLVSVNGRRFTREADFVHYLFSDDLRRERVTVIVMRDGREHEIIVEPQLLFEEMDRVEVDPLENFGIIVDDRYNDRVVVWRVVPRSPAFYAGIRAGDVLTTFNGRKVGEVRVLTDWVRTVEPGSVAVEVNRGDRVRQIEVDFPRHDEARANIRANVDARIDNREDRRDDRRDTRDVRRDVPETRPAPPAPGRGLLPRNR